MEAESIGYIKEEKVDGFSEGEEFISLLSESTETPRVDWKSIPWSCNYCSEVFKEFITLTSHRKSKHSIIKSENECYQCNDCKEPLWGYSSFLNHIRGVHYECLKLCCDVCNKSLPDYKQLSLHRDKHIGISSNDYPIVYHCTLCEEVHSKEDSLKDHIKHLHNLKCSSKGEVKSEGNDIARYKKIDERLSYSNDLETNFSWELNKIKDEYDETELIFQCGKCVKNFSTETELEKHMLKHNNEQPFECEICLKDCKTKENFQNHMHTHTYKHPFKCELCLKSFTTNSSLQDHMRLHTGERPFKCNQCSKAFAASSNLRSHMFMHTDDRPFKCQTCTKAFKENAKLQIHMRVHTGERPFKCNQCPKAFSINSNLQIHMRKHTDERPYKCEICSKEFKVNSVLQIHMRRHTGECPYKCEICSKAFKVNAVLQNHMRLHTGERPFKCNHCPKTFTTNSSLQKHMKTCGI